MKSNIKYAWGAMLAACAVSSSALADEGVKMELQPVPKTAILEDKGYIVWGASMVQGDDGVYHAYYCRWKGSLVRDWYMQSEIVHATADSPMGPFKPQEVVLTRRPEAEGIWDGLAAYNPTVCKFGDKYYLYYTGCNGSNRAKPNEKTGLTMAQRIGVAVADNPNGPWTRMDKPLMDLSADGLDADMVCNPTVTKGGDGRYMMIYKCADKSRKEGGGIFLSVAFADKPTGPFTKTNQKILAHESSLFAVEDPFLWWEDGKYRCVVDDQKGDFSGDKGLILFESTDGLKWEQSDPFVLSKCEIKWADGEVEKTEHLERPQIWLKDGKPAILFAAVSRGTSHFNVHIPLVKPETLTKKKGACNCE